MSAVQSLFNQQKISFLSNIGTIIQPTTKQEFFDESVGVPLGLFSHSDQIQQWQTGIPHERAAVGWGGKIADIIKSQNENQGISMNISLAGTNIFQLGNETIEYAINPYGGSNGIYGYRPDNMYDGFNLLRTSAIDSMFAHEYQDAFKQTYVDVVRNSQEAHLQFQEALELTPPIDTTFTDNYTSKSFEMIARTIAAREALGVSRQIFFVRFGGWDHHDEVLQNQMYMLNELSSALGEFNEALNELNMADCVTTFNISEFGRTLTSNGNGTDHAWGGNVFVMGGDPVVGGRVFGNYPSLALGSQQEVFDGVIIPTLSTDSYFAELAMWFGVSKSEAFNLFPNLANFYNAGSTEPPIGFLNY
jgi:uncharacterized protein (DUF1501 family)